MIYVLLTLLALSSTGPDPVEGRWINPAGSVIIALMPCGEAFCGTVEWASEEAKADARNATDQLVGATILSDLRRRPDGRWEGRLFVPDANKRVHAKIRFLDENRLEVSGCAIGRSLCRSQVWVRNDLFDPPH